MKNIYFALTLFLLVVIFFPNEKSLQVPVSEANKNSDHRTIKKITKSSSKTKAPIKIKESRTRKPASIKQKKTQPSYMGREVFGLSEKELEKLESGEIRLINEINPHWDQELKEQLLGQLSPEAEITTQSEHSYIQVTGDRAYYREKVKVTIESPKLGKSSYRALIDPQTSQILRTWERTVFDANPYVRNFRFR